MSGLRRVTAHTPGLTRLKRGRKFIYQDADGVPVSRAKISWIEGLAIPPAWENVWIAPNKNCHILVTGRDSKGRKQYIYHPAWQKRQQVEKFDNLATLSQLLSKIRKRYLKDLSSNDIKTRFLALVLGVLDETGIRIGHREYEEKNKTYGAVTLRKKHLTFEGSHTTISFRGKAGIDHEVDVDDKNVVRALKKAINEPGYELFSYKDNNHEKVVLDGDDVNSYISEITEGCVTAKDFRTWYGSMVALAFSLGKYEYYDDFDTYCIAMFDEVASELGNTRAVTRAHYIHPEITKWVSNGQAQKVYKRTRATTYLDRVENTLKKLLNG